jgi:hypothetical protein
MSGLVMPARTWAFVGEIVTDSLSQLAVLGHRVEVNDHDGGRECMVTEVPVFAHGWTDVDRELNMCVQRHAAN